MDYKPLPIGIDNFEMLISRGYYFIDKTLNMSVLQYFFEDRRDEYDVTKKDIEDREYDMELRSEGYKNVIKYGIAFYQKDCLVKIKE